MMLLLFFLLLNLTKAIEFQTFKAPASWPSEKQSVITTQNIFGQVVT